MKISLSEKDMRYERIDTAQYTMDLEFSFGKEAGKLILESES